MKVILVFLFSVLSLQAQESFEVYFNFNQDIPNNDSLLQLNDWIIQHPLAEITKIHGFCDSIDSNEYNKKLAERRINQVLHLLQAKQIKISDTISKNAIGEEFEQFKIQAENRKVTFWYITSTYLSKPKDSLILELPETIMLQSRKIEQGKTIVENDSLSISEKFIIAQPGDIVRLNDINFYHNRATIIPESEPRLDELAAVMLGNPNLKIEIHGHICCNRNTLDLRLSIQRAVFIYMYLIDSGVVKSQMSYKGFGSSRPIYPLPEKSELERSKNRRVEIKIITK